MRRLVVAAVVSALALGASAPVAAQDGPSIGDSGPAEGDFQDTDGACGSDNFTDGRYVATLGEDERGVYIEFTQSSTGDTGRFRADRAGTITFETEGDEVYDGIQAEGDTLHARYTYTSGGCTQEWAATATLPPGFVQALIAGNAAPPAAEESTIEQPPAERPAPTGPATVDDGGGSDLAALGIWGLLMLLVLALLLALFRSLRRPRYLYRADPGDPGVIIERGQPPAAGSGDDGETEVGAGPPEVVVDDGEATPAAAPASERDCEPEREELQLAQEAKDAAYEAGEQADRELAQAKGAYLQLEAALTNPLGEDPPGLDIDEGASEADQARQRRVHELNVAEWRKLEEEAADARDELAGARAAFDKAKADRDEAWEDFQRMRRRLEAARVALDDCDGSAPPADGEDEPTGPASAPGSGDTDDAGAGGSPLGIVRDPPETAPDPRGQERGCTDGAEKDGRVVSSTEFRIAGGVITVEVGTSAWSRAGRTFSPDAFAELDTSTVEELSAGIEQQPRAVRIAVRIPTTVVTVTCVQILICRDNRWVDSGRARRVEERAPGRDLEVLPTGAAGGVAKSKDRRDAGRMVEKAQGELEALRQNEEGVADCECD